RIDAISKMHACTEECLLSIAAEEACAQLPRAPLRLPDNTTTTPPSPKNLSELRISLGGSCGGAQNFGNVTTTAAPHTNKPAHIHPQTHKTAKPRN
ncbi:MAG: hypothetical protein OEZ29_05780, partial [Candidatus Bathyarchaeota archaeon]|nr:hypothetical protein [Candidatus Bathyarchaeota archaeon]